MSGSHPTCTHHDDMPAIAVCTRCNGDICAPCHHADLRGFAICGPCRRQLLPPTIAWERDDHTSSLARFFTTAMMALRGPRSFFSRFSFGPHWGPAAFFGILCIAVGSAMGTGWQRAFSDTYAEQLQRVQADVGVSLPIIEFLVFATIPFAAVMLYFVHTALLFAMLRIARVQSASWTATARITGYSMAAHLLFVFPPVGQFSLGHFLMLIWLFNLEVAALRGLFGLRFWKSIGVVLLPLFVFMFTLG